MGQRCLKVPKQPSQCTAPCNPSPCLQGCGTGYITNFSNDAIGITDSVTLGPVSKDKVNIAFENGNQCFSIQFLPNLPAGALSGLGQSSITTPSSPPTVACGDIEVCCGWYQYTLANAACVLWRKATMLALIAAVQNLGGQEQDVTGSDAQSNALIDAFTTLQPFIEGNLGWYKLTRHTKSQTVQLWLSSLPSVEPPSTGNVNLISFTSGYANLVLDGVYKQCKGSSVGGRRYTGALNGSQLSIFEPNKDGSTPQYPVYTDFNIPTDGAPDRTLLVSQTSRTFGTLSINVVIPSAH